MPKSPCIKSVHIKPVTGLMDVRSNPDDVAFGGYRFVKNMVIDRDGRLARMPGWDRAFADLEANNWDLHDQDLGLGYSRQKVTMLFQATTPTGFSKLFAGTQNRIYALNSSSGNWRVISDELGGTAQSGCPDTRFEAAQVNETVVFTNGEDGIVYHVIDQPILSGTQAVQSIPDLEEIGVTKAKTVIAWNNMILLMNIEQDGQWMPNRILWSDFERPLSFLPGDASLSGYQDIDWGDSIIAAKEIKGSMIIYTTRGIWEMRAIGGDEVFSITRRWRSSEGGKKTLAFKNTLVSTGEDHWFLGGDGIYRYDLFIQQPEEVEWVEKASKLIFEDINQGSCAMHVGGYQGDKDQVWFSWGKTADSCPSETLILNVKRKFTTSVDHGITAFLYHEPDQQYSVRDFILERCICTLADLSTYGGDFVNEGGFCVAKEEQSCGTVPASFYSQTPLDLGTGVITEDWTGAADADSLFTILGSLTVGDICNEEYGSDECNAERKFLFVSESDQCIKEASASLHRETCTDLTGCGAYSQTGYQSRLLSSAMDLKIPDDDKALSRFAIEAQTIPESIPAQVSLKIGMAANAVDPRTAAGYCVIMWDEQDKRSLACLSAKTAEQHRRDGTRPNSELEWGLYHVGRYVYFDITILNEDSTPQDKGGSVQLSRFTFDAVAEPRSP